MKLTSLQYAQALHDAVSQARPDDLDKVMDNFVKILAQNGDVQRYDEIEGEYKRLEMKAKGIREAEVTFAREIKMNKAILDDLNSAVDGKAEFKSKIDEGIVGGVIIKVDDTLIDASVKGQLSKLNEHLKN
jgi:F-type H+-transporting ATPase subunit delta